MTNLNKAAVFTDIHWGRKNNSELHNQDCLRFIKWFCEEVKTNKEVDHIIFTGDWFEQRSAINSLTLDYAYKGALLLKELNLPIYFIVGNHDLYYRNSRDVCSTNFFESLDFNLIKDEPLYFEELGEKGTLLCPFLFEEEYPKLAKFFHVPVWFGHFEFKGFVVTGETKKLDHGPDPKEYSKPKRIFSGHFHKRQTQGNIIYIGNTFPADFSDANDLERGMMIYTYDTDNVKFIDWPDCPSYINVKLSQLAKNPGDLLRKDAIVRCVVDKDINYNQSVKLKERLVSKYKLREISLEETSEQQDALEDTEIEDLSNLDTVDDFIVKTLGRIEATSIKNEKLIEIYKDLGRYEQ